MSLKFTLAQYNILGEAYASPQWFPYCSKKVLQFSGRSKLILHQLEALQSDIICLQELDNYESFWKGKLEAMGYGSIFHQRPGKPDGCGIFYKTTKFKLIKQQSVSFEDKFQRVGLLSAFSILQNSKKKSGGNILYVATTHLYWDHTRVDVQLAEIHSLVNALATFNTTRGPTIVAGDFNSDPTHPVYKFMKTMEDARSSNAKQPNTLYFRFNSSYSNYEGAGKEPLYTSFKPNWNGCIDNIWYWSENNTMGPLRILQLDPEKDVMRERGLPDTYHPSDHLPLCTEFGVST